MLLENKSYSSEEDNIETIECSEEGYKDTNNNEAGKVPLCCEDDDDEESKTLLLQSKKDYGTDFNYKREIVWKNVLIFLVLNVGFIYGLILWITKCKYLTFFYAYFYAVSLGQTVTTGSHRLWAHRAYKARPLLKYLMLYLQTAGGQDSLWTWVRDHRQHHRYSDTDADPHNARRGLFFSHIGWLMSKKHPLVIKTGKTIDMSDIEADPWIMFQKKHYTIFFFLFAVITPVLPPVLLWNEDLWTSFFVCFFGTYVTTLHLTWSVNSLAHYKGMKPYKKNIVPVESKFVTIITGGEGWHNFHHVFPWDYRAGEWGGMWNRTRIIIEFFQKIGLAYDLKKASDSMIENRLKKTGSGEAYVPNTRKYSKIS